ncbi:hypothetical protein [Pararhodobacter sp.]
MKHAVWAALAGAILLAACGAGDPPNAPGGGIDLRAFWRGN